MSLATLTLRLYREAALEALSGLGRSAWAVVMLMGMWVVMFAAMMLLGPTGLVGGFILFLIEAWLLGTYLSLVEVCVQGQRRIRPGDFREHAGALFSECTTVMFFFWVPHLLLTLSAPQALLIAVPVASVVFNPVPEILYQERNLRGVDVAIDGLRFMQRNWPEWLIAQVLLTAPLILLFWLVTGFVQPLLVVQMVEVFGPFFGFLNAGPLVLALGALAPIALALGPLYHWAMLFRGQLYRRLRLSSRRQRAWQARL